MKPLNPSTIPTFLERFESFADAELSSLDIISPTQISLSINVQDKAKAFDWITLELEFSGVSDAKLVEESQLGFIDMQEGASLLYEEGLFAFGIGACYNIATIKNSVLFLHASSLKYEEKPFQG